MFFAHLDLSRRCLIAGALAGVVLELCVVGGFLMPHGAPMQGFTAQQQRSLELLPFIVVGGLSLLAGCGAFLLAAIASFKPVRKGRSPRPKRLARARH